MIVFKKLDHILICIPEKAEELAKKFYIDVIGLEEIPGEHPNGAIWFKIGDIELHLRPENGPAFISSRHPAFEVEHLQNAKDELERKGIELQYSSDIMGRQRMFFRDPFGNRFELIEYDG